MDDRSMRFCFGSFELNVAAGELRKSGLRIRIEEQPLRLLAALVARPGEILTRDELRTILWPKDVHIELDNSLARVLNKVRTALGDSAANPRFVETLPKRGYRFIAPVTVVESQEQEQAQTPETAPPVSAQPLTGRSQWRFGAVAGVIAVAVLAVSALVWHRQPPRLAISSIAVLPFENISGDAAQNYVAEALTDQLISALSGVHSWRVVSRTSVLRYKGTRLQAPQIGAELNVDAIVEGSVATSNGRARTTARLIQMPGERLVWTRTYDRALADTLGMQAELVRNMADGIHAVITPEDDERLARLAKTGDAETHVLYSQGRLFVTEPGRDAIDRGIQALQEVIRRDPGHAGAWAALAEGWFSLSSVFLPPKKAMPIAKAAAQKAIELDPNSDAAHAVLGRIHVFYDWDWNAAVVELRRAIELNPNSSTAHRGLAFSHLATGDLEAALDSIQRAIELDPMSLWAHFQSAMTLTCMHRYDEAEKQARRALSWEPKFGILRGLLAGLQSEQGRWQPAITEVERAVESQRVPTTLANLAQVYAAAGRQADSERVMGELVALSRRQYVCPYEVGQAYVTMGRHDDAFAWMEKAVSDRADCMIWLRGEPWIEPIRKDPRYASIVSRVGFPVKTLPRSSAR